MNQVFFSYSHRDEELRDRLEVHLSVLKRNGVIDTWHDRRIIPGSDLDGSIDSALESATLVLLLVSPDFLASDYCYTREMGRALERRAAGEIDVIPIILKPCAWKDTPLTGLAALPPDAVPVVKYKDYDEAFLAITEGIKRTLIARTRHTPATRQPVAPPAPTSAQRAARSSNLAIKKDFTELEHDEFLEDTFEYIARFFESSISELQARDASLNGRFQRIDAQKFSASLYRNGKALSRCWISTGGGSMFGKGIRYSTSEGNSMNEQLSVTTDGHGLHLKSMGMTGYGGSRAEKLTQEGGAELLWSSFVESLQ